MYSQRLAAVQRCGWPARASTARHKTRPRLYNKLVLLPAVLGDDVCLLGRATFRISRSTSRRFVVTLWVDLVEHLSTKPSRSSTVRQSALARDIISHSIILPVESWIQLASGRVKDMPSEKGLRSGSCRPRPQPCSDMRGYSPRVLHHSQ